MTIRTLLARDHWGGRIDFHIESRQADHVVARMPVTDDARNPFGTVHAGAMIWFADIAATLCAIGDPATIDDSGKGFPLAVDLHTVLVGNEKEGILTAAASTIKRGKKLVIVGTQVHGESGRLLIDMTTTHLRAD